MDPKGSTDESKPTRGLPDESPAGVDLTLIRWMRSLTYELRLQVLQDTIDSHHGIRHDLAED